MFQSVIIIFIYLFQINSALRLTDFRIPNHSMMNSTIHLECYYNLRDDEELYSVKWYKDSQEFYRYIPKMSPPTRLFALDGIHVNLNNSFEGVVELEDIDISSSGRFRCEVSGEAPLFQLVSDYGDMIVVVLPFNGPHILGGRLQYQIGDEVNVSCVSGPSKPAAHLLWFINDNIAPSHLLRYVDIEIDSDGLETTSLGLNFIASVEYFQNGLLQLKCLATIATIYWRDDAHSMRAHNLSEFDRKAYADEWQENSCCISDIHPFLLIFGSMIMFFI